MKQGQHTDAFFSSNLSEKLNFSLAFKGLRSLGNYQNILAGSKQFRFTSNYVSSNNKYNFKLDYVTQSFENQENGGLTDESLMNFESFLTKRNTNGFYLISIIICSINVTHNDDLCDNILVV